MNTVKPRHIDAGIGSASSHRSAVIALIEPIHPRAVTIQPAITKPGRRADGGARYIGVVDAAIAHTVSEVGDDQDIDEPNAVIDNRQGQEAAYSSLIEGAGTLQCALETKGGFDHILEG